MKEKNLDSSNVLDKLVSHILISLNELFDVNAPSEFNEGGRYAYIECLEILSRWSRFADYGIENVEEKYPIK